MNSCYLCQSKKYKKRNGTVRDNPNIKILECTSCGLVFLSSFSHISEHFYESSKMHDNEIELETWLQETEMDDARRYNWIKPMIEGRSILDFGCGVGGFLLRARKKASTAEGVEPEERLIPYFKKNKLKVFSSINDLKKSYDVITLFHVLEHIPDPSLTLTELAEKLNNGGQLIVEVPNSDDALLTLYENEAFSHFTYWSCHLFLFKESTLYQVAEKAGLKVNYIKQIQRYSLANHLYWLTKGQAGGHKKWHFIDSDDLNKAYEKQLASIGCCDTIIASFSK